MPDEPLRPEDADMACDEMLDVWRPERCPQCGCVLQQQPGGAELYCFWCGYEEVA